MTLPPLLATLVPIRDADERPVAWELRTSPATPAAAAPPDVEAEATLALVGERTFARLAGRRTVHVPVSAGVVKRGALSRFASRDLVFQLPVEALDDAETRRTIERLAGLGFRFGFVGDAMPAALPASPEPVPFTLRVGARGVADVALRVQRLRVLGALPIARGVADRATRRRIFAAGVAACTGTPLPRGRGGDLATVPRLLRALGALVPLADGRPPDARFDALVADDATLAASVVRAASSAALGTRGRPSVTHALRLLGRERVVDRLVVATAFLLGEVSGDAELPRIALERTGAVTRLGAAVDVPVHPRACAVAALVSLVPIATGLPAERVVAHLALPAPLADVLGPRDGTLGRLTDLVNAHEQGWWDDVRWCASALGLRPDVVTAAWRDGWVQAHEELAAQQVAERMTRGTE